MARNGEERSGRGSWNQSKVVQNGGDGTKSRSRNCWQGNEEKAILVLNGLRPLDAKKSPVRGELDVVATQMTGGVKARD